MKKIYLFLICSFIICLNRIDCTDCSTLKDYVSRILQKDKICTDYIFNYLFGKNECYVLCSNCNGTQNELKKGSGSIVKYKISKIQASFKPEKKENSPNDLNDAIPNFRCCCEVEKIKRKLK